MTTSDKTHINDRNLSMLRVAELVGNKNCILQQVRHSRLRGKIYVAKSRWEHFKTIIKAMLKVVEMM